MEEALAQAEATAIELVRLGRVEDALKCVFGAIREALRPLVESVKRQGEMLSDLMESVGELRRNVDKLTADVGELTKNVDKLAESVADLRDIVAKHEGAIREFRGWRTEWDVADRLEAWFKRKAPEYEIIKWFKMGADVLIEGKGILVAVEITTVPYREAVDRVKNGVGAVKNAWGREPDVLVIWSESGVVPEEVAKYAAERGVRVVRGVRELRALLDEVAKTKEGVLG